MQKVFSVHVSYILHWCGSKVLLNSGWKGHPKSCCKKRATLWEMAIPWKKELSFSDGLLFSMGTLLEKGARNQQKSSTKSIATMSFSVCCRCAFSPVHKSDLQIHYWSYCNVQCLRIRGKQDYNPLRSDKKLRGCIKPTWQYMNAIHKYVGLSFTYNYDQSGKLPGKHWIHRP